MIRGVHSGSGSRFFPHPGSGFKILVEDLGYKIRDPWKIYSGSRGGIRHRVPSPQHWLKESFPPETGWKCAFFLNTLEEKPPLCNATYLDRIQFRSIFNTGSESGPFFGRIRNPIVYIDQIKVFFIIPLMEAHDGLVTVYNKNCSQQGL